jgi:hypothetical protein
MELCWPAREAEDDRARWLPSSLPDLECERPRLSSVLIRVRVREERPPIIELNDFRPNVPDVRGWLASEVLVAPFVESALDVVRSRPFESACCCCCCFVSTFEEDHLEKRGVVGREEAGEEFSDTELVRELGTWDDGCWETDEDEGRLATEEERERLA